MLFILTAGSGLLSDGVYHEDDLTHFLFARWTRHDARYLIDEWGRPGFTALYALPAMIGSPAAGWHAGRLLSAVLTAATALLAYHIARWFRLRHAWIAIPLVYLQPLVTRLSLTTLTETPLAFYFALATWLVIKGRPAAASVMVGLTFVTRHESAVLAPIWALALWRARARWYAYPLMGWAIAVQNVLGAIWLDVLPLARFIQPDAGMEYGRGTPLTYVPRLLLSAGPVVAALAGMGVRALVRRSGGWLVVSLPIGYFAAHTLVYMSGAYASGGYARFLVPMAPWLAVLATAGIEPIFLTRRPAIRLRMLAACGTVMALLWLGCEAEWWWRPPVVPPNLSTFAWLGRGALALLVVLLAVALYRVRQAGWHRRDTLAWRAVVTGSVLLAFGLPAWGLWPLRLRPAHETIREAVRPLQEPARRRQPLIAVNFWVYYWTDRWKPQDRRDVWNDLTDARPGTLLVWDKWFSPGPGAGLPFGEIARSAAWKLTGQSEWKDGHDPPAVAIFERLAVPPPR